MDAKEIKRHIDTVEDMLSQQRSIVDGSGHECSSFVYVTKDGEPVAGCPCECHERTTTENDREQALTAALAAMRQVANVQ